MPGWNDVYVDGQSMEGLGFRLRSCDIPLPDPKTSYVDVPGGNGLLDYTEAFGSVMYYNRENVSITFGHVGTWGDWEEAKSAVARLLHGRRQRLSLGWESGWYYEGRLLADMKRENDVEGVLTIGGSLDPYKYAVQNTDVTVDVSGIMIAQLENGQMPVVPSVTASASGLEASFLGEETQLQRGTYTYAGLVLPEGGGTVTLTGSGRVTFSYRQGRL